MRKLIFALSSVFLFVSCSSEDNNSETPSPEANSISMDIENIYNQYKDDSSEGEGKYTTMKLDPEKTVVLGVADALGGLFGMGGGPYGALWGGFGMSYLIADVVYGGGYSVPSDANIYENSDGFIKAEIGIAHNKLLFEANQNYKHVNLLDYANRDVLKNFLHESFEHENFEENFLNNEAEFYSLLEKGTHSIVDNELSFHKLNSISENRVTSNEMETINQINEKVRFIGKDDVSHFLRDVENYVLNNNSFRENEKERIFVYTGILNSSYHFWDAVIFE